MTIKHSHSGLSPWDKRSSQSVEQIYPGITRIWMHGGRIVCYSITTIARPAVDAWMESTHELVHSWPRHLPYLSLHDISEATLTPYIRKKTGETALLMPRDLYGKSALILPRT